MTHRFKVGIVGLDPDRGWAMRAHVPALRALADRFEIAGVANSHQASAERAARTFDIARAFADVAQLVSMPDIDLVLITVRVPAHLELVRAAIAAGKHVYCEWPLGNGLAEAVEMATLARAAGVLGVIGTQAPFAPEISYAKSLVAEGFIGEVLSTTLVAYGGEHWGGEIANAKNYAYLLDHRSGATMLTIPVGHALAGVSAVLGDIDQVSSVVATRHPSVRVAETNELLTATAPDQVLVSGVLASGAPLAIHYRGGAARDGRGLFWEINGTDGDLRILGALGHPQMVPLVLQGVRRDDSVPRRLEPPSRARFAADPRVDNVARMYASIWSDLTNGTTTAPSFDVGVKLHALLDAIERAAATGQRISIPRVAA